MNGLVRLHSLNSNTPNPKEEAQRLVDEAMPFAVQLLEKYAEFFPFGRAIDFRGGILHHEGYPGGERPLSDEVIRVLRDAWKQMAAKNEIRATALVYDIRTIPPGKVHKQDAICIDIDHKQNYSIRVIFPYSIEDKLVTIEDPFAIEGEYAIF